MGIIVASTRRIVMSLDITAATIDLLLNTSVICLKPGTKTYTAS
jgi:hypothetical protein